MKKLFLIPILLASLFLCACQASDEDDYTSKLRLNITHIDESDDEKAMGMLLGKDNWLEIKNYIESQPNYQQNMTVTKIEIFSVAFNVDFEVMASRFQQSLNA